LAIWNWSAGCRPPFTDVPAAFCHHLEWYWRHVDILL